jgi:hypothetical protein
MSSGRRLFAIGAQEAETGEGAEDEKAAVSWAKGRIEH